MASLLEQALNQVDDAEVYSIRVEKYPVVFSGNRLKSIKSSLSRGMSLRVIKDGKLGFSSDSMVDNSQALIDRAIASAKLGPPSIFSFCRDESFTPVDVFDPRSVTFEIEEAVEMGQKLIDYILKRYPDTVNDVHITRYFLEITYQAQGVEKTYYKTVISRSLSCMQVTDDGLIYIDESDSSCRVPNDILAPARRVTEKIPLTKKSSEMPSKKMTVIFHPKAVYNLTNSLIAGLNGTNLVSGTSPLIGKFNKLVLDQRFTMADDPTMALESESESFDGEGLPRRRLVLFDQGVVSNYLLDLYSGAKLGMESNGCASRGYDAPPSPGSSNLVISEGDVPIADMIADTDNGLLVEEVIGGGQSNVIAGEFSTNVSLGYKIEQGKKTSRVRNTMIAGNVYELMKDSLEALSVERETYHSIRTPYVMFKNLSVSGRG